MQDQNEINDLSLDNVGEYQLPEQKEIVVDIAQNKVLDTKDFTPIQLIYLTAKQKGINLKEFPINEKGFIDSGCKKEGCFGRGYKGWEGNVPIPCTCLFEDAQIQSDGVGINRRIVRNYQKVIQKENQRFKESKMKELGLHPIGNGIYGKYKKGTKELLKYEWKKYKDKWNFSRVDLNTEKVLEEND